MQLHLMSGQGKTRTLDKYFASTRGKDYQGWETIVVRVEELVRYMQTSVEAPEQWITFSHLVMFYLCDEDTYCPEKARVFVYVGNEGYRIQYRSARELDWQKSFTILLARSLKEAGEKIELAFQLAEKDLPSRFDTPQS